MLYTDGTFCPWKGKEHRKLMEVPTTFLRWAMRERPEMVDKYPGLREYIETRTSAEGCVRSTTREARADFPSRGKTPKQLGIRGARPATPPPARQAGPPADLFALAAAMRGAAK